LYLVVLTLYGHQQGARVGYNPKKRGRRSYHPLLCFEAQRHEFWHGSLRPGNAASNTGVIHFLRRCLAKVPPGFARARIRVRADAGYFSGKLVREAETLGLGYVIVARKYRGIQQRAQAALKAAAAGNVSLLVGDGTLGWSAYAPYHAILVAAGGPEVPQPLVDQLAPAGRMIIPLGAKGAQTLTLVRRTASGIDVTPLGDARFVPLVGEHGFDA